MILTVLLFFIATFGLIAAGVIGYRFVMERQGLTGSPGHREDGGVDWVEAANLLKSDSFSTISIWDKLLARVDYVEIMKVQLAEAGLGWSVGRLTLLMLLVGSLVFGVLANWSLIPWWIAVGAGLFCSLLPYLYVLRKRRLRLYKIELQFPEALDTLARAMRAGHPLLAGVQLLAMEAPDPLAGEMQTTVEERKLGLSWDQALDNLATRLPLVEVSTFVAAVKLQNRTGGKLSEVLGRLADTMREAGALKGEVRAIAAHGRMTGTVLTILPVGIAIVMATVNPNYLKLLLTQPTGQALVAGAIACLILAHFVIRKMVDIKI